MKLSKKTEIFYCFLIKFLESTLNFEHFHKKNIKNERHNLVFRKLLTPKDVVTLLHKIVPVAKNPSTANVLMNPENC